MVFLFPVGISPSPALSAVSTLLSALSMHRYTTTFTHSTHRNSGTTWRDELFCSLFISVLFISQRVTSVSTRLSICVPKYFVSTPVTGDNRSTTNFLHTITVRADCFLTNLCAKYTRFLTDSQSQRHITTAPVSEFWDSKTGAAEGPIIRGHAGSQWTDSS